MRNSSDNVNSFKLQIFDQVKNYYRKLHPKKPFVAGVTRITYAGRVYDEREIINLVDAALDFWLTAGPYADQFEKCICDLFSSNGFLMVNSGSSANLLMLATLCSKNLSKYLVSSLLKPLKAGDEIITPAVTFPTTLTPILQYNLVPVFVDCEVGTYNINPRLIEDAIRHKTRAIFIPHTLGNPCDMEIIIDIAKRHNLWILEDCCDALGATFNKQMVGTFGAMSSLSFFPAHQITTGEGGGVVINQPALKKTALSIRDWGRDCWCEPGKNNTCGNRFEWQMGELPLGYDHKFIYTELGYNLKATDLQAAIGLAQMEKFPDFLAARRKNFNRLFQGLKPLEDYFIFPIIDPRANPSPFGFPITVRPGIDRNRLLQHLESSNIETRLIFGGNILRQPGFLGIEARTHGELTQSDEIMKNTFFVGVYPGLTEEMIDYIIQSIRLFISHV